MRCNVILHMMISIDGKIDGDYMNQKEADISGVYYDEEIFHLGTSMASGRKTAKMYHALAEECLDRFTPYTNLEDYVLKSTHYHFIFDRYGKCFWDENHDEYASHEMQIVEVLTDKVDKRYLSYLRWKKISYIILREENYLKGAVEKIYHLYGVKNLVLTGGSQINTGFLKEDLIDTMSLVVAPFTETSQDKLNFVQADYPIMKHFVFKKVNPLEDGGFQILLEKKD